MASANTAWYPDLGASDHVTGDLTNLQITDDVVGKNIIVANGNHILILHSGDSNFLIAMPSLKLTDILHAPVESRRWSMHKRCNQQL